MGGVSIRTTLFRLPWVGDVPVRWLVVGAFTIFVLVNGIVTAVTDDATTLLFLGATTLCVLGGILLRGRIVGDRVIRVYTREGLYIAEHTATNVARHGETPGEAVTNLDVALANRREGSEQGT